MSGKELSAAEWAVIPLKKYATFSGRAPRAEYWWFYLATVIGSFAVKLVDKLAGDLGIFDAIYSIALIVPQIAVTVRRLHDTDRSGRWLFILAVPLAFVAATGMGEGAMPGTLSSGPMLIGAVVLGIGFMIGAVTLLVFSVQPGTDGPNRYGDDPYGPDQLEEVFA